MNSKKFSTFTIFSVGLIFIIALTPLIAGCEEKLKLPCVTDGQICSENFNKIVSLNNIRTITYKGKKLNKTLVGTFLGNINNLGFELSRSMPAIQFSGQKLYKKEFKDSVKINYKKVQSIKFNDAQEVKYNNIIIPLSTSSNIFSQNSAEPQKYYKFTFKSKKNFEKFLSQIKSLINLWQR